MSVKISVAVPTHKRAHYLKETLLSICAQTRVPDEIVVSEDGRDGRTFETVKEVRAMYPKIAFKHIASISDDVRIGQLKNRQQAFRATSGDFVAMLDDDDVWEPQFLASAEAALLSHPACAFVSSNHYFMDDSGRRLIQQSRDFAEYCGRSAMSSRPYEDVLSRTLINNACVFSLQVSLFRRGELERVGFFQPSGGLVPDYMLMLALGARGLSGYFLTDYLGSCRVHSGQQTAKRLENVKSKFEGLAYMIHLFGERLTSEQRRLLVKKYQQTVLEYSIALAHAKQRSAALQMMTRTFNRFGSALPSPKRLAVLLALLLGVRKLRH
ncbi:glycosyltransferase family 2 protein [Cohnella ginsengisoli]|uniref:Glycosyltransferase family 2 protein n=1 Tax=Cohnella ginsengisoli TaxID=425004 RepID=A0A9X4KFZ7_9BACL|nr:glycosyltransferase family 2 protein [Cohnella ginsengisoli]MDG0791427.1 glycosyltransferase family 2 protein [Cohnella ginsengisoli]